MESNDHAEDLTVRRTTRRDVLRRGAVAGGLVWAAPAVTSAGRVIAAEPSPARTISDCDARSDCDEASAASTAVGPEGTLTAITATITPGDAGVQLRLDATASPGGSSLALFAATNTSGVATFADVDVGTIGAQDLGTVTLTFSFVSPSDGEGTCEQVFFVNSLVCGSGA